MTIYTVVVTREAAPDGFEAKLRSDFEHDHLKIAPMVWLVAGTGPAKDISDALGISDGTVANGLVCSMSGYFGRAPTNVWDWIKDKWEEKATSE